MHNQQTTSSRKRDHIELCLGADARFITKTNGFERYSFIHNALPELNFDEISTASSFLGKTLQAPIMISCMTGGYDDATQINAQLAETAERCGVAIGVGSQRQALENSSFHESFSVIRLNAPNAPVIGNIGGDYLVDKTPDLDVLIGLIEADAIAVHLNPLQELLQPEGNPRYRGVLQGISRLVKLSPVPIIIKEVGAGINATTGRRLLDEGVSGIDCAGAGGTSWAGVEILRRDKIAPQNEKSSLNYFWDWGIPTAECISGLATLKKNYNFTLIGSGGISDGIEAALALALGADIAASARPFLTSLSDGGVETLVSVIKQWQLDIKRIMFLTGVASISDFSQSILTMR